MANKKPQKLTGKSANFQAEFLELLKKQSPEIFSEGKVDCQKLKQTLGEEVNLESERYGLTWAGKSDCFGIIQEPTTATLIPDKKESVDFEKTENLFIEGDNLEVLKILQKSYYGKIKMIYIDPPYNTGNDFVYNDTFKQTREEYEKDAGIKDEEGNLRKDGLKANSKDGGHYHSTWLNMMYPRLFLARNLLRQDGVIFVSIDDNEAHNLKMMMNEIFGEENFISMFVWKTRQASGKQVAGNNISVEHEYILVYQRAATTLMGVSRRRESYSNPDNDPRGDWAKHPLDVGSTKYERPNCFYTIVDPQTGNKYKANPNRVWAFSPESMDRLIKENKIIFDSKGNTKPYLKKFWNELKSENKPISTWLDKSYDIGYNTEGTKLLNTLFDNIKFFDYPKPVSLIKLLISQALKNNDIILDFFAGSGTTAHAVVALNAEDGGNRKCISVQLPELTDKDSEAYKAGFKNIADIAKERIRRAGKQIEKDIKGKLDFDKKNLDLGFKVFKLNESNFKIWRTDIKDEKELIKQMDIFVDNLKKGSQEENILFELILKSGLDLNVSIEKKKADSKDYYTVDDNNLVIYLGDKISKKMVDEILKNPPQKFICLDKAFANNDQLKTNTILQMESAKVDFKVI